MMHTRNAAMGGRACIAAVPDCIPRWIACSWQFQAFATQEAPPMEAVQELLWWASDTDADMGLELLELLVVARASLSLMFSLTRTADGGEAGVDGAGEAADDGEAGVDGGEPADDSCAICFEDMTAATMEVLDTCAHVFCRDCVALMSGGGAADVTCPLCRQVSWWAPPGVAAAATAVVVPPPPAVDSCPVCLEDVAVADMDVLARCRHAFCSACTGRLRNAVGQITCPLCRAVNHHSGGAATNLAITSGSDGLRSEYAEPSGAYYNSRGSDWPSDWPRLEHRPPSGGPGNASNLEDWLYAQGVSPYDLAVDTSAPYQPSGDSFRSRLESLSGWLHAQPFRSRLASRLWPEFSAAPADGAGAVEDLWEGREAGSAALEFPSAPPADGAGAIEGMWEGGRVVLPPAQPAMEFPQAVATARRLQAVRRLSPRALRALAGPTESLRDRERRLLALDTPPALHDDAFSSASVSVQGHGVSSAPGVLRRPYPRL
jgi:hypothetical protein